MAFPESFLEEIRGRLQLSDLVGRHVRLTRRGREALGLCPFHHEKTPSFTVNDQKGFFHCFGCGAHGSLFDFVMRLDNVGFAEAVAKLAADAGLPLPAEDARTSAQDRHRAALFAVLEAACAHYERMLRQPEGGPGLDYLRRRGLDDAAIAGFRLGFAPETRGGLKAALARDGTPEALMIEAGLLIRPEDEGRSPYDRFRGRVMFPIADRRGRIVGFGGRILGPGEPKYLNSPETALFHKGGLLYAVHKAAPAARQAGRIIVVEGYMDAIGLAMAGFPETTAPLGTALTEDQVQALWTIVPEPIVCFDPDAAGRRAAVRAAERALPLLRPGTGLKIAFLETDTRDDPDGVTRRYPRQFIDRTLAEAMPLSDFLFRVESGGRIPTSPEARAGLDQRLMRRTAAIADAEMRRHYRQAFRERLRWQPRPSPQRRQPVIAPPPAIRGDPLANAPDRCREAEKHLLAAILTHPELIVSVEDALGSMQMTDPAFEALRQELLLRLSSEATPSADELRMGLAEHAAAVSRILDDPTVRFASALAADAAPAEVLEYWCGQLDLLHRSAVSTELAAMPVEAEVSQESWERRRALIEARFAADDP